MSIWGNVIRGTVCQGNVHLGSCSLGNCPLGNCLSRKFLWGTVRQGNVRQESMLGKCLSGNCSRTVQPNVMFPAIWESGSTIEVNLAVHSCFFLRNGKLQSYTFTHTFHSMGNGKLHQPNDNIILIYFIVLYLCF